MIERKIQHQFSEGDVGLLGAAIERKCKIECCTKCARSMAHLGPTDELPPVVVIDDHPLKITSGIGVKFVAVPSSLILDLWQEKVLELQVLQQLRRCRLGRA